MRWLLSLLILGALSFARTAWTDVDRTILILGDSLSAGYEMKLDESWPSLLQHRLTEHGYAYHVFNSSIAGDTTQGGLTRLPKLLSRLRPAVVIIELGGNDGLRGLPLEVTRNNLQSIIHQSQLTGATVVLAGIVLPPNYGKTYTQRFKQMFVSLARDTHAAFIPFLLEGIALKPALMLNDGIHPTAQAQPLVLENVWRVLKSLLH